MSRILQHVSLAVIEVVTLSVVASAATTSAGFLLCSLGLFAALCPLLSDARQIADRIIEIQTVE